MAASSVALKLADDGGLAALGAVGAAAEMVIEFACIAVPLVRLHSMRQ